jgi:hypothetical protein
MKGESEEGLWRQGQEGIWVRVGLSRGWVLYGTSMYLSR